MTLLRAAPCVLAASLLLAPLSATVAATRVTEWTKLADAYGNGLANWRTQAIMHQAIHDTLNAATPTFERWNARAADEPSPQGVSAGAAIAAAAARVLLLLHPSRQEDTERALHRVLDGLGSGPAVAAGITLGEAIGQRAVELRDDDGSLDIRLFAGGTGPGRWARTPLDYATSKTSSARPFLFSVREVTTGPPPPAIDSDVYRTSLDEVRRLGGVDSTERTEAQAHSAFFWASQSSQRGYLDLAIRLLDQRADVLGLLDQARIMSQMTAAMADSAINVWRRKEHFAFWRPVTAIRAGSPGVTSDPRWLPLLETPPFPEYPSGHAADCYTGSVFLEAALGPDVGPITYVSLEGSEAAQARSADFGMGQHAQPSVGQHAQLTTMQRLFARRYESLAAAAQECAESRIWAGAHFRPSIEEALRLARLISERAIAAVAPIGNTGLGPRKN
jgi:hypothetical protein